CAVALSFGAAGTGGFGFCRGPGGCRSRPQSFVPASVFGILPWASLAVHSHRRLRMAVWVADPAEKNDRHKDPKTGENRHARRARTAFERHVMWCGPHWRAAHG